MICSTLNRQCLSKPATTIFCITGCYSTRRDVLAGGVVLLEGSARQFAETGAVLFPFSLNGQDVVAGQ
jgi:hypothetical protein